MARELLRSVDGRQLPNLGEVAVYWPNVDCTNIFDTTGFEFTDKPDNGTYPELIEHDAEATAFNLLAALIECRKELSAWMRDHGDDIATQTAVASARAAIAKATGRE